MGVIIKGVISLRSVRGNMGVKHIGVILAAIFTPMFFIADISDRSNLFTWLAEAINGNGFLLTLLCIGA